MTGWVPRSPPHRWDLRWRGGPSSPTANRANESGCASASTCRPKKTPTHHDHSPTLANTRPLTLDPPPNQASHCHPGQPRRPVRVPGKHRFGKFLLRCNADAVLQNEWKAEPVHGRAKALQGAYWRTTYENLKTAQECIIHLGTG